MARNDYTPEQAIGMQREAEVRLSRGEKVWKSCRDVGTWHRATTGGDVCTTG